ncbi:uncharacterized protein LOC102673414 [Apis dorsata]|uniref:uncharacterized protein LOC102673414 n=1 Tax=Apis dorsata TaxID=7462 RepID=UPI0003DF729C|nr:uncharacterized protein LOC102673414 [Apis dorsata]
MEARILGIRVKFLAAGRNISGIVIQDHRRRQGHVISTIRSTGEFASWTSTAKIIRRTIGSLEHSLHDDRSNRRRNSPGLGLLIQLIHERKRIVEKEKGKKNHGYKSTAANGIAKNTYYCLELKGRSSKCNELVDDRVVPYGSVNYGATCMEVAA